MFTISNNTLKVVIAAKGAELQSIYNTETGLEYMWSGDAAFWGKKSPVLFPIVGGLKNNTYQYNGNSYNLGRHGFARDMVFEVSRQTSDTIAFTLKSSSDTHKVYPFDFRFSVIYSLKENQVKVTYEVENTGNEEMLFSVGGHPAFKVPVAEGTSFNDYFLHFNKLENEGKWPLSPEGLIETKPVELLNNTQELPLHKPLFYGDALVFKSLQSDSISILSEKTPHGLEVSYQDFPFMGIWSAKDADFVCIEPWCGIADSVNTTGNLEDKEGINRLDNGEIFTRSWQVSVF